MTLFRVLAAESIKLRRTLALWMCLIAPAVVVALYLMMALTAKRAPAPADAAEAWAGWFRTVSGLWSFLMLPLFITLEAALLAGLEHANQQWKHLFSMPVPRWQHYVAKLVSLLILVTLATTVLLPLSVLGGWVVGFGKGVASLQGVPVLDAFPVQLLASVAAASLMIALHTFVSLRWSSFTAAVAFGMSATVAGFLISQSSRWGHWYPWGLPMRVFLPDSPHFVFVVEYGLMGGLLAAAIGTWLFSRREMA
ncbi:MAG: ABC transporter permease [Lysobacteraceae bacterium]